MSIFKIAATPTWWTTVKIPVAGEDPVELRVEFKRWTTSEIITAEERNKGKSVSEVVRGIVAGWSGQEREFSPEALDWVLEHVPGAGRALLTTFMSEQTEARRGN